MSRQGLQKVWLQGMHSGCSSTPLHTPQVNSRSARSCWLICAICEAEETSELQPLGTWRWQCLHTNGIAVHLCTGR